MLLALSNANLRNMSIVNIFYIYCYKYEASIETISAHQHSAEAHATQPCKPGAENGWKYSSKLISNRS